MKEFHHAVVFDGHRDGARDAALLYVREVLDVATNGNPDLVTSHYEQLTVDHARELKERSAQAPLTARQVFVLDIERITREAQNSLLKLFEEPSSTTHFLLVVPSVELLLPTVRSRLAYGGRFLSALEEQSLAESFLAATDPKARIKLVQKLYTNVKDSEKLAVRIRARAVVDALETTLHARGVQTSAMQLRELVFVRRYLADTSSSLKMLMEHLVYTL